MIPGGFPPRAALIGSALLVASGATVGVLMGATGSSNAPHRPTSAADVRALLTKAADAPREVSYTGVESVSSSVSAGEGSITLHVSHTPAANDAALASVSPQLLLANYACLRDGTATVAGRPATVVAMHRGDAAGPVAARFWLDAATGLLLRRDVYDGTGALSSTARFTKLSVSRPAHASTLPTGAAMPAGWHAVPDSGLVALRPAGWQVPAAIAGLTRYDVRAGTVRDTGTTATSPAVQLSFSDGVSTVSVFEEHGRLAASSVAGWTSQRWGATTVYVTDDVTRRVMWATDGVVYTMVAQAPGQTVRRAFDDMPGAPDRGVLARAHRGIDRVGSWFDPFH